MHVDFGRRVVLRSIAMAGLLIMAGCKIVPIVESGADGFNAQGYAGALWAEKALPFMLATAHPIAEVLVAVAADYAAAGSKYGYRPATEGSPWTFLVSGTGTVVAKNTKSRAGTLTIALDGVPSPTEIAIQIGPVVRGNAVRDSLPFVSFKDFTNQLEFADVGKAFTSLAMEATKADVAEIEEGQNVAFNGAMSMNGKTDAIVVTPVSIKATAP